MDLKDQAIPQKCFFDTFETLCHEKGISCKKAAVEIGLSHSITSKWKRTGAVPNGKTLNMIAAYFSIPVDCLLNPTPDLYNRIAVLCKENGKNITTMCKESGTSRASLSDLKMGRSQSLSAETLSKIANHFGVSVDYLLGLQNDLPTSTKSSELIKRIEMRLAELGMSKSAFYEASGVSSATFSQWRTGTYCPSQKKLAQVAAAIGLSVQELIEKDSDFSELEELAVSIFRRVPPKKQNAFLSVISGIADLM